MNFECNLTILCIICDNYQNKQLVNCCAAYQALLHQRREERERDPSYANKEDQLDIDMDRLSAAVQAVDGMLDEIDRLLKVLFIY